MLTVNSVESKDIIDTDFNYKLGLGFNYSAISSYYDKDFKEKAEIEALRTLQFKTENGDSSYTTLGDINIDYLEFHNDYFFEYKVNNDFVAELNLNIAYYSMDNSFTYKDTLRDENQVPLEDKWGEKLFQRVDVPDLNVSLLRMMYVNPKINYYLANDEKNRLEFELEAFVPFSFNNTNVYEEGEFIGDGYFQIGSKLKYRAIFETTQLELAAGYSHRSEVFSDMINASISILFTRVKDTYFYVKADYNQSLTNPENQKFIITQLPAYESYIATLFGLNVNIDEFELDLNYTFIPYGRNFWLLNRLNASFHYFIK